MSKNISCGLRTTQKANGQPAWYQGNTIIDETEFNRLKSLGYNVVPHKWVTPFPTQPIEENIAQEIPEPEVVIPEVVDQLDQLDQPDIDGEILKGVLETMAKQNNDQHAFSDRELELQREAANEAKASAERIIAQQKAKRENIAQIKVDNIAQPKHVEPVVIEEVPTLDELYAEVMGKPKPIPVPKVVVDEELDFMQLRERELKIRYDQQLVTMSSWKTIPIPDGCTYLKNDKDKSRPPKDVLIERYDTNHGVNIRDESSKYAFYRHFDGWNDYYKAYILSNKVHNNHEVINMRNRFRLVLDLDITADKCPGLNREKGRSIAQNIIEECKLLLESDYKQDYEQIEVCVCDSSGVVENPDKPLEYKASFHIVFPKLVIKNAYEGEHFIKLLIDREHEDCKYIDAGIYNVIHNLRIVHSTKGSRQKRIDPELSTFKYYTWYDTLVTLVEGTTMLPEIAPPKEEKDHGESIAFANDDIKFIDEWLLNKYNGDRVYSLDESSTSNTFIRFTRLKRAHCFMCDRAHDNQGAWACAYPNGYIIFGCHAKKGSIVAREGEYSPKDESNKGKGEKKEKKRMRPTGNLKLKVVDWKTYVAKWHTKCFDLSRKQLHEEMVNDMSIFMRYLSEVGNSLVDILYNQGSTTKQVGIPSLLAEAGRYWTYNKWGKETTFATIINKLPAKKLYIGSVFEPNPLGDKKIGDDIINRWTSWPCIPSSKYDSTKCQPIIDHLNEVICSGNGKLSYYLTQYCACIAQGKYAPTALILYSRKQGVGKNIFTDYLSAILGEYSTVASLDQLTGRFNEQYANKSLIVIDELSKGASTERGSQFDKLKRFITAHRAMSYEGKGKPIFTAPNRAHLIFTTNWTGSIKLEENDRRYTLIECSDKYVNNDAYFEELGKHLDDPIISKESQSHFLRYLLDMPITLNMRKPFMTKIKQEQQRIYAPGKTIEEFVHNVEISPLIVHDHCGGKWVQSGDIWNLYEEMFGGTVESGVSRTSLTKKLQDHHIYTENANEVFAYECKVIKKNGKSYNCMRINPRYIDQAQKNTNGVDDQL